MASKNLSCRLRIFPLFILSSENCVTKLPAVLYSERCNTFLLGTLPGKIQLHPWAASAWKGGGSLQNNDPSRCRIPLSDSETTHLPANSANRPRDPNRLRR